MVYALGHGNGIGWPALLREWVGSPHGLGNLCFPWAVIVRKRAMSHNLGWQEYKEQLVGYWGRDHRDALLWYLTISRYSVSPVILEVLNRVGGGTMARGKGSQSSTKPNANESWTRFVNISLAGVTKEQIDHEYGSGSALADGMFDVIASGHRVGFSYDKGRDCVICSFTGKEHDCVNVGCTLTSFAQTWPEALAVNLYKHYVLAGGSWLSVGSSPAQALFG